VDQAGNSRLSHRHELCGDYMSEYTLQKEICRFSKRWGCTAVTRINLVEHEMGRKFTDAELDRIVGAWFRLEILLLCNYKDHKLAINGGEAVGWSEAADPEWHYWVVNRREALRICMMVGDVDRIKEVYDEVIMDVSKQGGTKHYALQVRGGALINPDPDLHGPIISVTRVEP
jgi:hypothetical protein